jgi:NAD-dependent dihydropyrimidine dehydrogenase PreA subunit/flavodoxin
MKIKRVYGLWYSGTGSTQAAVRSLASALGEALSAPVALSPLSTPAHSVPAPAFGPDDLAVLGTPTYAGRVPNKIRPFFAALQGGGAPAVPVVLFGNRNFDNALAELCSLAEADGFCPVAAAALAAQHAFAAQLGAGRPDAADREALREFAEKAAAQIAAAAAPVPVHVPGDPEAPYYTPLGLDGKPAVFLRAKPATDPAKCDGCGVCAAVCPMGAIDPADPKNVPGTCIKCQACVKRCPRGAKYFDDPAFLSHRAMLEKNYLRRAAPAFFFAQADAQR